MRNIARPLLEKLAERCTLARPEIVAEQVSADGTRKWLLRMAPAHLGDKGAEIECVYIPEQDRGTLCVSSQVGCTLNCVFCHTGTMPLVAQSDGGARLSGRFSSPATGSAIFPAASPRPTDSCRRAKACARCRTSSSWAWASRSTISTPCATRSRSLPTATACRSPSGASPSRPRASFPRWRGSARNAGPCSPFRCMRPTMRCATNWSRSTGNIRSRRCFRPAATTPAPPTPAASLSST